jgi:hypothetical protein
MKVKTPLILIVLPIIILFIYSCRSHDQTDSIDTQANNDTDYLAIVTDAVVDDGKEATTYNNAPSDFPKYYTSKKMDITFPVPKGYILATNRVIDSLRKLAAIKIEENRPDTSTYLVLPNSEREVLLHKYKSERVILIQRMPPIPINQEVFEYFESQLSPTVKPYEGIKSIVTLKKGINIKEDVKYFHFRTKTTYSKELDDYTVSQEFIIETKKGKCFSVNINDDERIDGIQFVKNIR